MTKVYELDLNQHLIGLKVIRMNDEFYTDFKQLIQRGANLWPDAPAEIKEFADLITNGEILQDYKSQE